ncbi:MAG: hypothetical protein U1D55_00590 [Phycisphaerae bacterium]
MNPSVFSLHNHTPFSDGAYSIDEVVEAHLDVPGVRVEGVGISDHLFCTPSSRLIHSERDFDRVFAAEARRYVAAVHDARRRWQGRMRIFCGAEISWPLNKGHIGRIRESMAGLDYVLFENLDWAGLTTLANQARRWPCSVGLAHTAVEEQFPSTSMDQVVRTMANTRLFYELNVKLLPLERHERWLSILPQHRVMVSLGVDVHDDLSCIQQLPILYSFVEKHGLAGKMVVPQPRVVTPTPAAQIA